MDINWVLSLGLFPLYLVIDACIIFIAYKLGQYLKRIIEREFGREIIFKIKKKNWLEEDLKNIKQKLRGGNNEQNRVR